MYLYTYVHVRCVNVRTCTPPTHCTHVQPVAIPYYVHVLMNEEMLHSSTYYAVVLINTLHCSLVGAVGNHHMHIHIHMHMQMVEWRQCVCVHY